MEQPDPVVETLEPSRSRSRSFLIILAVLLVAVAGGLFWHKHALNRPVQAALADETGAKTSVYRRSWIGGNDIVFDVESVGGETSMVDMTRRLLTAAETLEDYSFDRVYLAHKGNEKFYFDGSYFKRLGQERDWQNPVYTIRTMPENVYKLDGTPAFGTWTGGWLGVMGEQFEDNNRFHREWWVEDELANFGG